MATKKQKRAAALENGEAFLKKERERLATGFEVLAKVFEGESK